MTNKNEQIIETVDENGNKVSFELLDIVTVDDIEYALLLPSEPSQEDDENEVLVMRLKKEWCKRTKVFSSTSEIIEVEDNENIVSSSKEDIYITF